MNKYINRNDYEYDPEDEYLLNGTLPEVAGLATPRFAESGISKRFRA